MCDTFGVLGKHKIFGKNSDRSPNEIQVLEYIEGYKPEEKLLKLTYLEIPQEKKVNSIIISRPKWMWGAEMGVNEYGLVIGNEAIFTKGRYEKKRPNRNGHSKTGFRKMPKCQRNNKIY